jgi:hypothetical protein
MGSVGEDGSVAAGKTRYVSSAFFNRNKQLAVLKIRVSMVRFRPRPPLPKFLISKSFRVSRADYRARFRPEIG